MKLLFAFLIALEILLCYVLVAPRLVDDCRYKRTFGNWLENPTPETESILKTEEKRVKLEDKAFDLAIVGLLLLNTVALYQTRKRIKKMAQPGASAYRPPAAGSG